MTRFLLYAVPAVIVLYALIDALQTPRDLARTLPKWLWLVVIILVPLVGALAWLVWGRAPKEAYGVPEVPDPAAAARRPGFGGRRRGPTAPDDDPAFLRQLDDDAWSRKMRERRESGDLPAGEDPGPLDGHPGHPGHAGHDDSDTPDSAAH